MRKSKCLNNIVEQDHRFIKKRIKPMLGLKSFDSARKTISGIENIRIIQKRTDTRTEKICIMLSIISAIYSLNK